MFDPHDLIDSYRVADRTTPRLRVNFIASIDGAASHAGLSGPLNNEDDKQVFDTLRMLSDVVLVGAGTLRDEGYGALRLAEPAVAWRLAHGLPAHPTLAVVSSRLDLSPGMAAFADAPNRAMIVTHADAPDHARRDLARIADVVTCGATTVDPRAVVTELAGRGLPQILCEGGPHLLGALIEADCVDELCLTIAPVLEGGAATRITAGGIPATREMRLAHVLTAGDMIMLRYLRAR
jgi:riboflavin biosynthesis pyrimidine reductase